MDKTDMKTLDRYMDGELRPSPTNRIASMLKDSPEAQRYIDRNRELGNLLRMANEEKSKDVSFVGLADRVLNEIGTSDASLPLSTRIRTWFLEFFEHKRIVWIPAAAVSAVALTLLFVPLSHTTAPLQSQTTGGFTLHSATAGSEVNGSQIASVDFGTAAGTTYNLTNASGSTVGVVWIEENP